MKKGINIVAGFLMALILLSLTFAVTKNLDFVIVGGLPMLAAFPYMTYRIGFPFRLKE